MDKVVTYHKHDDVLTFDLSADGESAFVPVVFLDLKLGALGYERDPDDIVNLARFEYAQGVKEGENVFPWEELDTFFQNHWLDEARKRLNIYRK